MENERIVSSLVLLAASSTPIKVKRSLILNAESSLIKRIVSLIRGVLFGDIPISDADKKLLSRYRARVHSLGSSKKSELIQRQYLAQKVSLHVLSILLSAVLPSLGKESKWEASEEPEESQALL